MDSTSIMLRKSLLYIQANSSPTPNPLPPDIPITRDGFSLLGCPVGPASFGEDFVLHRVEKVNNCLYVLPDLEDSQIEITLLRSCFILPKVSFFPENMPPEPHQTSRRGF